MLLEFSNNSSVFVCCFLCNTIKTSFEVSNTIIRRQDLFFLYVIQGDHENNIEVLGDAAIALPSMLADTFATTLLAPTAPLSVLADAAATTLLALPASPPMLADATATTIL
jgi:hypothetical protein